jgi:Ca-activated chloride channel family protein
MTLRDSSLLWLLAFLPIAMAIALFAFRARRIATARFGGTETVLGLIESRSPKSRAVKAVIAIAALGLLILAAAGPQHGSRSRTLRRRGVDVVIALDFSKSMLARDVGPNRIERSKAEIRRMLAALGGDRVGIVGFAGETIEFPMTTDYPAIELFLGDIGPYDMPVGGTAIGRALVAAGRLLERSRIADQPGPNGRANAAQAIVLITDGEDHEGDPVAAARELAERGVKIFVLGVGSRSGETIPTYAPDGTPTGFLRDDEGRLVMTALTDDNERQLREIASASGGRYFRAREGTAALEPIRREIGRLQAAERRIRRVTVREDRYALVLLPAFLLFVLEGLLPEGAIRRRRRERSDEDRTKARGAT